MRIYHHELHQNKIKKYAILKLQLDDNTLIEGHSACAAYLEDSVSELLQFPPLLDAAAQDRLLAEVETVFTAKDNALLMKKLKKH